MMDSEMYPPYWVSSKEGTFQRAVFAFYIFFKEKKGLL